MFALQVKGFIGQYASTMGGIDAVIFTAGIGENDAEMRYKIISDMEFMGIEIDKEKNLIRGEEIDISTETAKVRTLIIPTNEELAIARDTYELVK